MITRLNKDITNFKKWQAGQIRKLKYYKAYQKKLLVFLICWSANQEIQKTEHSFYDSLESERLLGKKRKKKKHKSQL